MNLKLGLLSFGIVFVLAACGERGGFVADVGTEIHVTAKVEKTDRNLTPRNTYVIEMPNQAPLIVGALNPRGLDLTFDKATQTFKLVGGYDIVDKSGQVISNKTFELSGVNKGDHPVLTPNFDDAQRDERVRAAITCLVRDAEESCTKVILDLVVKKQGAKENFAAQVEIDLEKKTVVEQKPAAPKAPKKETPQSETPNFEVPKTETPKVEMPKAETPRAETPKVDAPKTETPKVEAPKKEAPKTDAPKTETPKVETPKAETPKVETPKTETPKAETPQQGPADMAHQDHEDDEDDDEEGGLYVGTLYQDTDSLFLINGQSSTEIPKPDAPKADAPKTETPKPAPTTPAPAPAQPKPNPSPSTPAPAQPKPTAPSSTQRRANERDQAIGMAANGTLEHPSSLMESMRKGEAPAVMLIYPSRERYYGTWEMIDTLEKISSYMRKSVLSGYTMAIGDISQKSGGRLVGSAHKSHQNGLDVDVAYPMMNIHELAFTDLVSSNQVSKALRLTETFQLFEYAQKNLRNVDRIFVDSKIKRALCDMSEKQGMLDSGRATEVLRRLRPASGHDNHFHLRIRCSPQQPRCRMMAEPLAGSGCEAVR